MSIPKSGPSAPSPRQGVPSPFLGRTIRPAKGIGGRQNDRCPRSKGSPTSDLTHGTPQAHFKASSGSRPPKAQQAVAPPPELGREDGIANLGSPPRGRTSPTQFDWLVENKGQCYPAPTVARGGAPGLKHGTRINPWQGKRTTSPARARPWRSPLTSH